MANDDQIDSEILLLSALHRAGYGYVEERLANPEWGNAGRVHDWRNYIPVEVQEAWPSICRAGRLALLLSAERAASNENWDWD